MFSDTSINFRVNNAEQFKESVSEPSPTYVYLTFGKTEAWPDENNPPLSNTAPVSNYDIWKNMIGGKRITGNDVNHVIPRINWTANTSYPAYDHMSSATNFYVVNSQWNVFKCIANNSSSKSNNEPVTVSTTADLVTADGYVWKYLYSISDYERLRFSSDDFIPVKTLANDDGSTQWQVQQNAIEGGLHSIVLTNGGANYSNASNITIEISGDGQDASAVATINTVSQTVNAFSILSKGTGYTRASIFITGGGGTGASGRAIIAPPGGHGSDPLYELGGSNIMLNGRIKGSEGGKLPVANDYRQVSLISNPKDYLTGNTSLSNTTFLQATVVTTVGSGDYFENERVYQGISLGVSTFRGTVLSWDSVNSKIYLINTEGTPLVSDTIVGANSVVSRFVTSYSSPESAAYSGRLIYTDNVPPITRSEDQTEEYKIVIKF
jgi:hypothetical protein